MSSQFTTKPPSFSTEGYHNAICTGVIFIGEIYVYDKWQEKIYLQFEMPFEKRDYSKGQKPLQPKQIMTEFSLRLYANSTLLRCFQQWLGKDVIKELDKFSDPYLLIHEPCSIKIAHKLKGDKWIEEVVDIKKRTIAMPEPYNQLVVLVLRNDNIRPFDAATFLALPEFVRNKVKSSKEWERLKLDEAVSSFEKEINPFV